MTVEMDLILQCGGWILAFVTGIWATWVSFEAKKKDDLLVEIKAIVKDGKVETGEVIDFMRKWITEQKSQQ